MPSLKKFTGYELSRQWFEFCFNNSDLINSNHSAIYFFAIELCNQLGWKDKFGFPSSMAKEATGIKSYKTYSKNLNDLVRWGFIKMVQKSQNQYTANIIGLVLITTASTTASTTALTTASLGQVTQQVNSKDTVYKLQTKEKKETKKPLNHKPTLIEFVDYGKALLKQLDKNEEEYDFALKSKYHTWNDDGWKNGHGRKIKNWKNTLGNTIPYLKPIYNGTSKKNNGSKYSEEFKREILEGLQSD